MSYNIAGNIRYLSSHPILYSEISQFPTLKGYYLRCDRSSQCYICLDCDIDIEGNVY